MFFSTVIVWWLSILMIEQPESVFGIIKGENATIEEFPWQVALFYKHSFICGAVIINKDWLLTAKNCILNVSYQKQSNLVNLTCLNQSLLCMCVGRWHRT